MRAYQEKLTEDRKIFCVEDLFKLSSKYLPMFEEFGLSFEELIKNANLGNLMAYLEENGVN